MIKHETMLAASVLFVALSICGGGGVDAATDKTTRIYGGSSAAIKDYPYIVAIMKGSKFLCAGAIVSDSWVMALGDCVYTTNAGDMKIVAGSDTVTSGKSYSVSKTVKHPTYNHDFGRYNFDFYLIKIDGTFTLSSTVAIASLPSKYLSASDVVTAVGFADPSAGGMRKGSMNWQSSSSCKSNYGSLVTSYSSNMGCAYNKGKVTLCYSDVGDVFVKDGTLYGFFSRGITDGMCTSSAKPVLAAYVVPMVSWIKATISS